MNPAHGGTWSSSAFAFGLDVAVRATAILMIVLLIQHLLGRRRALLGSAAGNAGLIGLLLLPLSVLVVPSVPIACLPAWVNVSRGDAAAAFDPGAARGAPHSAPEDAPPISLGLESVSVPSQPVDRVVHAADDAPRVAPAPVMLAEGLPVGPTHRRNVDWVALAIVGYGLGALVLMVRLGRSLRAVARFRRSCAKVDDAEWIKALARWRERLEIGRDVHLAWSPKVSVPIVLGWFHPMVVLPGSLMAKNGCVHSDAVLLHELSHVRRSDYPWNLCLRFVQALYWPHVLIWLLGRAVAVLRERACDDLCVHELGGPTHYRETLLAVASETVRRPKPALGLAMADPSKLGRRLARIEQTRGHALCVPRRPVGLAIAGLVITVSGLIGAIQLVRAQARSGAPAAAVAAGRVLHLHVVAADTGEPVPDADVRVWIKLGDAWRKTDAHGRLDITHSTGPSDQNLGVDVWGKGRAMQRHRWGLDSNTPIPENATVRLQAGETLGGLVHDEAGRPIAGATILLWSHNYKNKDPHELLFDLRAVTGPDGQWQTSGAPETTSELLGFQVIHPDFLSSRDYGQKEIIPKIAALRAGDAVTVMKKGVPIEGRVVDADGKPVAGARVLSTDHQRAMFTDLDPFAVSTDVDGRFRTGQVRSGKWFLVASARGHAHGASQVQIGTAVPQVEITLGRPRPFKGRVIDPDGKPIAGALVDPDVWREYRCLGVFLWTDADGRFRWDDAPGDELIVNVNQQGYRGVFQRRVEPSDADVVFTLAPSLRIVGKVRDAGSQKLVDDAAVEYGAVDPLTGEPARWTSMPELGFSTGVFRGNLDINFPVTADAYQFRVRSPGYQPFVSRTFRRQEKVVTGYDVALAPGTARPAGAAATVLRPDGKPLAGARVYELQYGGSLTDRRIKKIKFRAGAGRLARSRLGRRLLAARHRSERQCRHQFGHARGVRRVARPESATGVARAGAARAPRPSRTLGVPPRPPDCEPWCSARSLLGRAAVSAGGERRRGGIVRVTPRPKPPPLPCVAREIAPAVHAPILPTGKLDLLYAAISNIQDGVGKVSQGRKCREDRTGPDGRLAIPRYDKPWFVLILGDDSYAFANSKALEKSTTIQAKPYARIEGQYRIGRRPVPNQELALSGMISDSDGASAIHLNQTVTTDREGRFMLQRVVPAPNISTVSVASSSSPFAPRKERAPFAERKATIGPVVCRAAFLGRGRIQ